MEFVRIVRLDPPPVGELDENEPALHLVDASIILLLVVVDPEIKDRARPEFLAEKEAGVNVPVIVVVIRDQP